MKFYKQYQSLRFKNNFWSSKLKRYFNDLNVRKKFWGPSFWALIHSLALEADTKEKIIVYKEFLNYLTVLLPCEKCKKNLVKKLTDHPFYLKNGIPENLQIFAYTYMLHNLANIQISEEEKIPRHSPPYEFVLEEYAKRKNMGPNFIGPVIWKILLVLSVVYTPEQRDYIVPFLNCVMTIIPYSKFKSDIFAFMKSNPIDPYLRNNHDLFSYVIMMHNHSQFKLNEIAMNSLVAVKSKYFASMGEKCNQCG